MAVIIKMHKTEVMVVNDICKLQSIIPSLYEDDNEELESKDEWNELISEKKNVWRMFKISEKIVKKVRQMMWTMMCLKIIFIHWRPSRMVHAPQLEDEEMMFSPETRKVNRL